MKTRSEYEKLFESKVIADHETDHLLVTIYSNNIAHIYVKAGQRVTLETVEETQAYFATLGEEKRYYMIFEYGPLADLDPEVRTSRAKKGGSKYALVDAFVVNSLGHRLIADFYLRFNRPKRPTRIYSSVEKAAEWCLKKIQKARQSA